MAKVEKESYEKKPATIEVNGAKLALPFEWREFEALKFDQPTRAAALIAYYQHDAHTGYRYLSKPNPWIAENASYVYINEARTERWSTFGEYKHLITLLFVAASDGNKSTLTDGYNVENRINAFIKDLALIGRAHNWDKTRSVDKDGKRVMEEYDDLEGDKPSCYSGVNRRLFQSLRGHVDFTIFGQDILNQELAEFLVEHFKVKITQKNIEQIKDAINNVIIEMGKPTEAQTELLASLDVPAVAQKEYIEKMKEKYKEELDSILTLSLNDEFKLKDGSTCHLFQYYNLAKVDNILETKEKEFMQDKDKVPMEEEPQSPQNRYAFFGDGVKKQEEADQEDLGPSSGSVENFKQS